MKQKDIFLSGEGDQLFKRNKEGLENIDYSQDLVVSEIREILNESKPDSLLKTIGGGIKLLEIGCGDGGRLSYLQEHYNVECHGIDPSAMVIEKAQSYGIRASVGTADSLQFDDGFFDILVFGFCLYLCDRKDLFVIAAEANRVIKSKGFIVILDFFHTGKHKKNKYVHKEGLYSFKMDYRNLFLWHPYYECFKLKVIQHSDKTYTDEVNEWIGVSVLRKNNQFIDE